MAGHEHLDQDELARGGWWIPLAATSAIVVLLAVAAALILGRDGHEPSGGAALSSRLGLAARAALVALGSDEAEFETARAELLKVLDARSAAMPEQTRTTVTENLEIIEAQIAAISAELERDPDNQRLARLLAAAYQRELELLQRAAAMPSAATANDQS